MTLRINKLIYLLMAVFLIVGISGCTDSKSGISGSTSKTSVSSKLATSENSGIFSEKVTLRGYGECKGLRLYKAVYNNGDTLQIFIGSAYKLPGSPDCDELSQIRYYVKNSQESYRYGADPHDVWWGYFGPSGKIDWTKDGRVNPSSSTGDINEANELINVGKKKANEIVNRYNSGQLR